MEVVVKSISSDNTAQIASRIGKNLLGGETVVLTSDLGGGKTVFVKGLAKGSGSKDQVSSPTFTITKIYKCPNFDIHHFDFYRLNEPGVMSLEINEIIGAKNSVVVIEWADIIKSILPKQLLEVVIINQAGNNRDLIFKYPNNLAYLLEGVG